jgi:capsular polysaccharide export protein
VSSGLYGKKILLLQGPMGDFFKRLDDYLRSRGAVTFRIGFNAADALFSHKDNYTPFRGRPEEWREYIRSYLKEKKIDNILLFGDCRYYQSEAIKAAKESGVEVYVFEEGYIRPNYVTLEPWGVNAYSSLPKDPAFYKRLDPASFSYTKADPVHPSFGKMAFEASIYYIIAYLGKPLYPHYRHHRELDPFKEAFYGLRSLWRKQKYKFMERGVLARILQKPYFFVPLQTHSDFQLRVHSPYGRMEEFIEEVMRSFALHAPKESSLVIKHHPMDRGRRDYTPFIVALAKELRVEERVKSVHDLHLPTLLAHTLGTITINSTVGLQALYHRSPVKVMGKALYDIEGLCDQKPLREFWSDPTPPDRELYERFRGFVIDKTQINGSFYGRFDFERVAQLITSPALSQDDDKGDRL